jgi:hypothetical protein
MDGRDVRLHIYRVKKELAIVIEKRVTYPRCYGGLYSEEEPLRASHCSSSRLGDSIDRRSYRCLFTKNYQTMEATYAEISRRLQGFHNV